MDWCIKGVNRSASTVFSSDGSYMSGVVDLQFSSSANLDIFELDFVSDNRQLALSGTAPSSERFNRPSWNKGIGDSEEYSLGLIAGGLADGNIALWNPKSLISLHKQRSGLYYVILLPLGSWLLVIQPLQLFVIYVLEILTKQWKSGQRIWP